MKTLIQFKKEVIKEMKPKYIVKAFGIFFEVCKHQEGLTYDYYECVDKFDDKQKAKKHCELLNKQYQEEFNAIVNRIAEYRFKEQEIIKNSRTINDLCKHCYYNDYIFCPIRKGSRIKKINGLSCNKFKMQ